MLLHVLSFLLAACAEENQVTEQQPIDIPDTTRAEFSEVCLLVADTIELSKTIETQTFSVKAPENWTFRELEGTDTYIGQIMGPVDTIEFDQGYLSFGGLSVVTPNSNTIEFVECIIDGLPAIIHKERRPENRQNEVRLSVYIDAGDREHRSRLFVFDPVDEVLLLDIFKTHTFKD